MSQHLTRKEIKRDELATVMERGVEYAESHAKTLFIMAGTALGLVLLSALFFMYRNYRAGEANAALSQAIEVFQAPIDPAAPKPDDPQNPTFADAAARQAKAKALFETLRDDYGSTEAGDIAVVYLGQIAMTEGQADRARELWNEFVDDHGDHLLASEVRINLFHLDRSQGKAQEVAQTLQAMLDEAEPPLPQDIVLHELGLTQEQLGKKQDAVQSYQRIVDEFPQSPFAQQARQKIGELDPTRAAGAGMGMPAGIPGMPGF